MTKQQEPVVTWGMDRDEAIRIALAEHEARIAKKQAKIRRQIARQQPARGEFGLAMRLCGVIK